MDCSRNFSVYSANSTFFGFVLPIVNDDGDVFVNNNKLIGVRFFALLLIIGGVLGMGLSIYMAYTYLQQHWIYLLLVLGLFVVFGWSALTGVRLWRDQPRGWKWAKILYAAQIPVLTVPGLDYEYYTGIAIKLLGGEADNVFEFGLGASATLYLDTGVTGLVYGVNLFAVIALIYLLSRARARAI